MINAIAEYAPNIKDIILHRQVLTPLDIERDFGLTEGNIFQGELTLEQLFFLRPVPGWAQYATPIDRLYMCGSATHPGGGIMGAPGRNAADAHPRQTQRSADRSAARVRRDRHRRRHQRPDLRRRISRRAGVQPLLLEQRADARRRRADRARSRRDSGRRRSRMSPARCARDVVEELQLRLHGLEFVDSPIHISRARRDGRALDDLRRCRARTAEACARGRRRTPSAWPPFQSRRCSALGARDRHRCFITTPPSVDDAERRAMCSRCCTRSALSRARRRTISGGCCDGDRWRWPISSASRSSTSCCARRSPPTAFSARCSVRGRRAAGCSCCSPRRIARWRRPDTRLPRGGPVAHRARARAGGPHGSASRCRTGVAGRTRHRATTIARRRDARRRYGDSMRAR